MRAYLVAAGSIAVAAVVALTPVVAHAKPWRLPLAIGGGMLLLAGCVFVFPPLLAPPRAPEDLVGEQELSAKDRIQFADDRRKLQNDIRTALLQAVVGGAVLVGVLFTWQQQQATSRQFAEQLAVTRQGQVGERFSRAVGQLGQDSIDVRLGGLYELEQLARQAPERRLVIIEVVAAYIREHARPPTNTTGPGARPPPQDIAAALTILSRRPSETGDPPVDLSRVILSRMNLEGLGANLRGAVLFHADLSGAVLFNTDLSGASLVGANLRGAFLRALQDADFEDADLRRANLEGANLQDAELGVANLRGAKLRFANLRGAGLIGADLIGADLHGADLHGATANQSTQWPDGFDWRRAGVQQVG